MEESSGQEINVVISDMSLYLMSLYPKFTVGVTDVIFHTFKPCSQNRFIFWRTLPTQSTGFWNRSRMKTYVRADLDLFTRQKIQPFPYIIRNCYQGNHVILLCDSFDLESVEKWFV